MIAWLRYGKKPGKLVAEASLGENKYMSAEKKNGRNLTEYPPGEHFINVY
jgi:hypothetical protein